MVSPPVGATLTGPATAEAVTVFTNKSGLATGGGALSVSADDRDDIDNDPPPPYRITPEFNSTSDIRGECGGSVM